MKKSLLSLASLLLTSISAFGQAQVVLANLSPSVDAPIGYCTPFGFVGPGPGARVALYFADINTMIAPATTFLNAPGFEKYINQVTLTIPGNTGQAINVQVRAWMTTGPGAGATWEMAATRAWSDVFSITPTMAPATPPDLVGLKPFYLGPLSCVPEPSTIACSLLGLGILSLFHRKSRSFSSICHLQSAI